MRKNKIKFVVVLFTVVLILNTYVHAITKQYTKIANNNSKNILNEIDEAKEQERSNNFLKELGIENYEMYPEFNKNTFKYYVSIPTIESSLEINAEAEIDDAKVKITGNTNLKNIENIVRVVVTSKSGLTRTYTIYATKQEDNGLKLNKLDIEGADLDPEFSQNKFFYNVELSQEDLEPLNIIAEANSTTEKIEILGNNDLEEGENIISIILYNGTNTTVYQINANITIEKKTIIEKSNNEKGNIFSEANSKVNDLKEGISIFFNNEKNTIILLSAIATILLICVIILIVRISNKNKIKRNRTKIKNRAK